MDSIFLQFEQLLGRLMELGMKVSFYKIKEYYRIEIEYKKIKGGLNCPIGQFKEGAYKALVKMADAMFLEGEKTK
jgi:hypothetical protein